MKRILVIGAGAMGCLFAARIAESGASVMLIDVDEARLAAIAATGIVLTDDSGRRTMKVETGMAASATGPFDLALLFTKGMHSRAAVASITHLAREEGPFVLTLQNGLGNPEIVAETFPPARVLKGMAALPADLDAATGVSSHGRGHVALGPMAPAGTQGAAAAAELLVRAGFDAYASATIDIEIWEKVIFNAALNALAAVTLQTNEGMDNPAGKRVIAAMVTEAVATAHAEGVEVDRVRIDAAIAFALREHGAHRASMLQDRLAKRPSEIESINGAICERARTHGIEVPVMETMSDLVRLIEMRGV